MVNGVESLPSVLLGDDPQSMVKQVYSPTASDIFNDIDA
jgi:hypothetical protein